MSDEQLADIMGDAFTGKKAGMIFMLGITAMSLLEGWGNKLQSAQKVTQGDIDRGRKPAFKQEVFT